jgi:hypothetical protein
MRRGTTPTIVITVTGEDFDGSTLYVTIEQGALELTKTGSDVTVTPTETGSTVSLYLTQEETLMFGKGKASIQIRWINGSGVAQASPIRTIDVSPILLEGVIEYGS